MKKKSTAHATTRSGKKKAERSKPVSKQPKAARAKAKVEVTNKYADTIRRAEDLVRKTELRALSPRAQFKWALRELKRHPENYNTALVRAVFIVVGFDPRRVDALIHSILEANERKLNGWRQ